MWRWDDAYDATIGRPLTAVAQFAGDVLEEEVIDGAVMGLVATVQRSSKGLRKIQTGYVRHYALAMFLGLALIVVYLVAKVG